MLCFKTLHRILQFPLFKDVYREVGILEVMVTCLRRYSALFEAREGKTISQIPNNMQFLFWNWALICNFSIGFFWEFLLTSELIHWLCCFVESEKEPIPPEQKDLGCLVMDCLTLLLSSNHSNASESENNNIPTFCNP